MKTDTRCKLVKISFTSFLMIGTVVCMVVLSGCTEKTASISTFERVETEDFILVYITNYTENMVVDLIQDEYEKGNTYIDCISLDVALIGRSDSMLLFQKEWIYLKGE